MILITKQHLANIAKDRWRAQYYENGGWCTYRGDKREITYNNLVALGGNPSPDDVNKVIGNSSWTNITCSECKESVEEMFDLWLNVIYQQKVNPERFKDVIVDYGYEEK